MGRAAPRRREQEAALDADVAEAEAQAFVHAWIRRNATITAKDRLHIFAGDGEEGDLVPAEIRRDPERLLKWTELHQPDMIVSDATAAVNARNRVSSELGYRMRKLNPKARFTARDVAEFIRREGLDA